MKKLIIMPEGWEQLISSTSSNLGCVFSIIMLFFPFYLESQSTFRLNTNELSVKVRIDERKDTIFQYFTITNTGTNVIMMQLTEDLNNFQASNESDTTYLFTNIGVFKPLLFPKPNTNLQSFTSILQGKSITYLLTRVYKKELRRRFTIYTIRFDYISFKREKKIIKAKEYVKKHLRYYTSFPLCNVSDL